MADHTNLIQRLRDESDLCSNEGAPDIAALLDEAVKALEAGPSVGLAEREGCKYAVEPGVLCSKCFRLHSALLLMGWQPMETAPRDGSSFLVPPNAGYTHCFWQEPFWWWHNGRDDEGYAAGPEPKGWAPLPKSDMSKIAPKTNTSEGHVVATYTRTATGQLFNATAAGLALPPGKYRLCVVKEE